MTQGRYVPKIHYGTGPYPYIRTSDLANYELRGIPKHGVSKAVFDKYSPNTDVQPGDVLLVHEGTYLIGTTALVTEFESQILIQHHLAKLRCAPNGRISPGLLIAIFQAPIVQSQIRSKQLTADIIDSIVGRVSEVVLPIPRDENVCKRIAEFSQSIFNDRARGRNDLAQIFSSLDAAIADDDKSTIQRTGQTRPIADLAPQLGFLGDRSVARYFKIQTSELKHHVLVPRYYDPSIRESLNEFASNCDFQTIGDLCANDVLEWGTGHELGKLSYGTGDIPYIRTSDLGNWEIKSDPKQRVSQLFATKYACKQSANAGDILLVRDGTYLVGTNAVVTEQDLPLLYSGGVVRIKCLTEWLNPSLLLALLNSSIVRRQLRAIKFTRDVIDTLGNRINELILPIPKSSLMRRTISDEVRSLVSLRSELRSRTNMLGSIVESGNTSALESWPSFESNSG